MDAKAGPEPTKLERLVTLLKDRDRATRDLGELGRKIERFDLEIGRLEKSGSDFNVGPARPPRLVRMKDGSIVRVAWQVTGANTGRVVVEFPDVDQDGR